MPSLSESTILRLETYRLEFTAIPVIIWGGVQLWAARFRVDKACSTKLAPWSDYSFSRQKFYGLPTNLPWSPNKTSLH